MGTSVFEFLMTIFSLVTEYSASLSTYNDQSITFVFEDGSYEIYVEDLGKDQEKGRIFPFVYNDTMKTSKVKNKFAKGCLGGSVS